MSILRSILPGALRAPGNERAFYQQAALALRVGFGLLFIIGGLSKLSQALDPARAEALVALYVSGKGYINSFFLQYLFEGALGAVMTPWLFLTALSTFELLSGIALVAGFLVRPLCVLYGLMLWSFVFSLPVTTSPGAAVAEPTYLAPALFVQVRDVGLSGLFFVLYNLGSGVWSLDQRLGLPQPDRPFSWEPLGLLFRLSLGVIFLVGGFFAGMPNIKDFGVPGVLLAIIGLMMVSGIGVRFAAAGFLAVMLWYVGHSISPEVSVLANLNGFKREIALLAASGVLFMFGGGRLFTLASPQAWRGAMFSRLRVERA
ncbi:MAG: DoxX family membrane protein [Pseudomonadota bacterium]